MNKILKIGIIVVVLFSIVFLGGQGVASANRSTDTSLAPATGPQLSVAQGRDEDCGKYKGGRRDHCEKEKERQREREKDKEKEWEKCKERKKHDDKCGTVKPPRRDLLIPVTGAYSIGGLCTLDVQLIATQISLNTDIQSPLPRDLPDEVQKVLQGCLLTYYRTGARLDQLSSSDGSALVCFAATPEKQMKVYFHDSYSPKPKWTALDTKVDSGIACAEANQSGVYAVTYAKP
jgi:hypothetical protein